MALAQGPTLTVQLAPDVTGPAEPLKLYFDQRLTFVLPDRVRLAVAGSADVLAAHVTDNVVVASLIDSEYVRAAKPRTNLTVLTEGGVAFTCTIEVASSVEAASVNLVEVKAPEGRRGKASLEAVALVRDWLNDPSRFDAETAHHFAKLESNLQARARWELATWVGERGFEVLAEVQRTRQDFIYLTSHGLARVGDHVLLRLSATNHSQPPFSIGAVTVLGDGKDIPLESLTISIPDRALVADGQPRAIGVLFPVARLTGELVARVCDEAKQERCVELAVR